MKNRAFTLVELAVVIGILLLLAALLLPVLGRRPEPPGRSVCQTNLKLIGLGVLQYAQDYHEKYPLAMNGEGQGWGDIVFPYLKTTQIFRCPLNTRKPNEGEFWSDYFSNLRLSGFATEKMESPANTVWGGDGNFDSPTWVSIAGLPPKWAPSIRHLDGANYLFADGHVKWMKPDKIGKGAPDGNKYTFEPK